MSFTGPMRLLAIASLIALAETDMGKAQRPEIQGVDGLSPSALTAVAEMKVAAAAGPKNAADAQGSLHVPDDYRAKYQFLGSWAVAADQGKGSQQIHSVYASPGAIAGYLKDGHFPDGAVLVKEVFEASTGEMTTGTVSRAETLKGWFVMVRDEKNRHAGNKLWGDGWGWSWFEASDRTKTTSTDYKSDCQSCHIPARVTDWIYVQGYPSLKK
jgi:hypothetical protein